VLDWLAEGSSNKAIARELGFAHAACAPLVRSSYHAELQAQAAGG